MFAVIWQNRGLDQLADVYVTATAEERARMAAGIEALNSRLVSDPLDEGESRSGGRRLTFTSLLAVVFHVAEKEQIVQVTGVGRYGK